MHLYGVEDDPDRHFVALRTRHRAISYPGRRKYQMGAQWNGMSQIFHRKNN